jgi:hypothetical protein
VPQGIESVAHNAFQITHGAFTKPGVSMPFLIYYFPDLRGKRCGAPPCVKWHCSLLRLQAAAPRPLE